MNAINLKTEHMDNPIGIDIIHPYVSWDAVGGKTQVAYEVEACCDGTTIWNSGKVASSQTSAILDIALVSRQRIDWKVRERSASVFVTAHSRSAGCTESRPQQASVGAIRTGDLPGISGCKTLRILERLPSD